MRGFLLRSVLTVAALGAASSAWAADLDYGVLRGPEDDYIAPSTINWSGFYIGAHGGYSSASANSRGAFQSIAAQMLRSTLIETEMSASSLLAPSAIRVEGGSYGGFVGYNIQFDSTVLGIEADYSYYGVNASSSDSVARSMVLSDGYLATVNLTGTSSTRLIDFGTIRGRAGYAFENFLPFVTAGVAIGRAKIQDQVAVTTSAYHPTDATLPPYGSYDEAHVAKEKTVAGLALGAGIDYAITPNILLRGEYQYVLFNDFDGHKLNVNTVRAGAAVKF